jgi:hypothetical protein
MAADTARMAAETTEDQILSTTIREACVFLNKPLRRPLMASRAAVI